MLRHSFQKNVTFKDIIPVINETTNITNYENKILDLSEKLEAINDENKKLFSQSEDLKEELSEYMYVCIWIRS